MVLATLVDLELGVVICKVSILELSYWRVFVGVPIFGNSIKVWIANCWSSCVSSFSSFYLFSFSYFSSCVTMVGGDLVDCNCVSWSIPNMAPCRWNQTQQEHQRRCRKWYNLNFALFDIFFILFCRFLILFCRVFTNFI